MFCKYISAWFFFFAGLSGTYLSFEHTLTYLSQGTSQQVGTTASVSFNNDSTFRTQPLDLLINKNTCGSLSHAQDTRPQFDLIKSVNCYNKNAFTLHVKKISPANKSAGKNTALYNGLGLASPTSSMEENVDGEQSSALHDDTPEESPDEIFQA